MRGEGRKGVFVGKEEPREKRGTQMKGTREKVRVKCVRTSEGPSHRVRRRVKRASVLVKMRWFIVGGWHPGSIWSELEELPVL